MLNTPIDHGTKTAFTHICNEIGLSPCQAIKLFGKAVINYGGIPFDIKVRQPNSQTFDVIQELEQGRGHKAADVNQLIEELGKH